MTEVKEVKIDKASPLFPSRRAIANLAYDVMLLRKAYQVGNPRYIVDELQKLERNFTKYVQAFHDLYDYVALATERSEHMEEQLDYIITEVTDIKPHPNADRLEIAIVEGWNCITAKGVLLPGDRVLYIAPDAQIIDPSQPWCDSFRTYLSGSGRVKTVKLRGEFSEGLIITDPEIITMIEGSGTQYIKHYEPPAPPAHLAGTMRASSLPYRLSKTDQENVQAIKPSEILGKRFLVTRKLDGASCTITFDCDTKEVHVCSRSIDLKLSEENADNVFIIAAKPIIDHLMQLPAPEGALLVLRGEVCGDGINRSKPNKDCFGPPTFHLFEYRYYPNKSRLHEYHLQSLTCPAGEGNEDPYKAVPILESVTLTQEIIDKYLDAPASDGEGVVLWECDPDTDTPVSPGRSFKIKSRAYDALL